jgi:hypothetical protein
MNFTELIISALTEDLKKLCVAGFIVAFAAGAGAVPAILYFLSK